jgi:hypothetical protein
VGVGAGRRRGADSGHPQPLTARGKRWRPEIGLSDHELAEIDVLIPRDMAAGTRYPEQAMSMLNG